MSRLVEAFRALTGEDPEGVWSAPGRVNLIGEHTDYNDGWALPFALPLRTSVAARRRTDGLLRVRSCQAGGAGGVGPSTFASYAPYTGGNWHMLRGSGLERPGGGPASEDERVASLTPGSVRGWAAYPAGVVWALRQAGHQVGGLDLVVDSEVPVGSGLSSSAALECAVALAASELHGLRLSPDVLARHCQRAENAFVGVPCGPIDQACSMLATEGHAVLLDTRLGSVEHIPLELAASGCCLLVVDTHTSHSHASGAYAQRRSECAAAAARLGVPALRDIPRSELAAAVHALAAAPVLARRVIHVLTENDRTLQVAALLRAGRAADVGGLLSASHRSLRDDFEVSSPALDAVVDAACAAGAFGARMTGGGFGGCAIALVDEERADAVMSSVAATTGGPRPTAFPATPSAGARRDVRSLR